MRTEDDVLVVRNEMRRLLPPAVEIHCDVDRRLCVAALGDKDGCFETVHRMGYIGQDCGDGGVWLHL